MIPQDMADLRNDEAELAADGTRDAYRCKFTEAQTRHYFRIASMYSSARTPIARNSMRRLYKAAGITVPSWIAPELDERVEDPLARSIAIRAPVRRFEVAPLLRRQAG